MLTTSQLLMQTEDKGRTEPAVTTPKLCNYDREKSERGRAEPGKEPYVTSGQPHPEGTTHRGDRLTAASRSQAIGARPEAQKT